MVYKLLLLERRLEDTAVEALQREAMLLSPAVKAMAGYVTQ